MRINKRFSILLFFLLTEICLAQTKSFIAVLELEAEGISESESRIITERLRTALFKTNQFIVLERDINPSTAKEMWPS